MALEAVIFDWDGPIADSREFQHGFFRRICELFGVAYPWQTIDEMRANLVEPYSRNYENLGIDWKAHGDFIHAEFIAHSSRHKIQMVRGIDEALRQLNGLKIGIASSNWIEVIERKCQEYGIAQYVCAISGNQQGAMPKLKPDPDVIIRCLEKLGVAARKTAYVGDLPTDIEAARAAGCVPIAVTWGYGIRDKLAAQKPYRICHKPEELMDAVL